MNKKKKTNENETVHENNARNPYRLKPAKRLIKSRRRSGLVSVMLAVVLLLTLTGCAAFGTTAGGSTSGSANPGGTTAETTMGDTTASDTSATDGTTKMSSSEHNFTLTDVKGASFTLGQTVGKKVYIKFWATWCSICLSGLNDLEQFSKDRSTDTDVVILTIVSPDAKGEMSREDFIAWYEKQGYTFPVLLDDGGQIARLYKVRGYPTSVFIDTSGKIVRSQPGHLTGDEVDILFDSFR